jgi:hypothetical protein
LPEEYAVHEAVGPSLGRVPAAACIGVGVNSLLVLGVLPVLLGALADEHRLTASGIGLCAMLEILAMGVSTAAMGLIKRPRRLRLIGAAASLALAGLDLMSMAPGSCALLALRAGAGAAEGVLLWITVSMIVRTVTPERWAGVFFTAQTFAQLLLAIAFAVWAIPRFGAAGGYAALAGCALLGVVPAFLAPDDFAPLVIPAGQGEAPPMRGCIALVAILVYISAGGAVGVYLEPLAREAGLRADDARTALWVSLVGQVTGGALATALAGRVRYYTVFVVVTLVYLATWMVLGRQRRGRGGRPVAGPVPGADDDRRRSQPAGRGAERRRPAAGRRPGAPAGVGGGERSGGAQRPVARRRPAAGRFRRGHRPALHPGAGYLAVGAAYSGWLSPAFSRSSRSLSSRLAWAFSAALAAFIRSRSRRSNW